jgi:hypothetical protein
MQTRNRRNTCSICLQEGADCSGDQCQRATHWFHAGCLAEWARTCTECPVCKKTFNEIVTQDAARSTVQRVAPKARPPPEEEELPRHLVEPILAMVQQQLVRVGDRMILHGPRGEVLVVTYG